jgi:hypothetical protein
MAYITAADYHELAKAVAETVNCKPLDQLTLDQVLRIQQIAALRAIAEGLVQLDITLRVLIPDDEI